MPPLAVIALAMTMTPQDAAGPAPPSSPSSLQPLKPPALEKGDVVALVAPASPLSAEQVRAAAENLRRRGFAVRVSEDAAARRGYLAGDDATRASALNALIRDPEVKAIICLRGGYGSPRILDRIDYGALRRQPKAIIGYSDVTALLLAVWKSAGLVAFHGPMGKEWSASRGITSFSERYCWDLLAGAEGPVLLDWGGERVNGMKAPIALVEGRAEGVLLGGNLSVLCALMGTPYEVDTRGAILFLEEVGEKPFRIDRMLNQLRLAGKLRDARGVLLGVFAGCEGRDPDGDLTLTEVFADYFPPLGVPVLADYPAGHIPEQATLPFGVKVRLDATARTLSILEPAVAPKK